MFKIMVVAKEGSNNTSTYQFLKVKDADGNYVTWSAETEEELEVQVEDMLNGNYAKKDFIVVQPYDYDLETTINSSILTIGGY